MDASTNVLSSSSHPTRRSRVVAASTDVPSSSSQPTYGLRPCLLLPIDRLGVPSAGAP